MLWALLPVVSSAVKGMETSNWGSVCKQPDPITLEDWSDVKLTEDVVSIRPERGKTVFCIRRADLIAAMTSNIVYRWDVDRDEADESVRYYKQPPGFWVEEQALDMLRGRLGPRKHSLFQLRFSKRVPVGTEFAASQMHGTVVPVYRLEPLASADEYVAQVRHGRVASYRRQSISRSAAEREQRERDIAALPAPPPAHRPRSLSASLVLPSPPSPPTQRTSPGAAAAAVALPARPHVVSRSPSWQVSRSPSWQDARHLLRSSSRVRSRTPSRSSSSSSVVEVEQRFGLPHPRMGPRAPPRARLLAFERIRDPERVRRLSGRGLRFVGQRGSSVMGTLLRYEHAHEGQIVRRLWVMVNATPKRFEYQPATRKWRNLGHDYKLYLLPRSSSPS